MATNKDRVYKIEVLGAELDEHYKYPILRTHETTDKAEAARIAYEAWGKDLGINFYVNGTSKQPSRYF